VTKFPQVLLAQWLHFLAIRADLNSSGIHESVQVQTAQEHRGPEFQDSCYQLFHRRLLKKPSPSKRRQSFNYGHERRVTESKTAEFCLGISSWPQPGTSTKMLPNLVTIELFSDGFYRMLVDASRSTGLYPIV